MAMSDRARFAVIEPKHAKRIKQASREADARALATGKTTLRDLERKNAFLSPERVTVRWDRSGRL
jgi:hypothetical protein